MTDARRILGAQGEEAVAQWYVDAGYAVVARNWRVRAGEIDLVAQRRGTVVFCEVKTRRSDGLGLPSEAVGYKKQARLRKLAVQWLGENRVRADALRFDVASVMPDGQGVWSVDVLEAAF